MSEKQSNKHCAVPFVDRDFHCIPDCKMAQQNGACATRCLVKRAKPESPVTEAMVDRFLSWPLPESVCADGCATNRDYPHPRSGTNLLTAVEARQMLEHVLTAFTPSHVAPSAAEPAMPNGEIDIVGGTPHERELVRQRFATPPFSEADRIAQQGPQVVSPPSTTRRCELCAPEFGCFDGSKPCCKASSACERALITSEKLRGLGVPHDWQPDGGVLKFESHPHGEAPHVHTTCAKCGARAWFLEYQWGLLSQGCTASATERKHWVFDAAEACRHRLGYATNRHDKIGAAHLTYMLDQIRDGGFTATKACRWLGWVQAALYFYGLPLEELKAINRIASLNRADSGKAIARDADREMLGNDAEHFDGEIGNK